MSKRENDYWTSSGKIGQIPVVFGRKWKSLSFHCWIFGTRQARRNCHLTPIWVFWTYSIWTFSYIFCPNYDPAAKVIFIFFPYNLGLKAVKLYFLEPRFMAKKWFISLWGYLSWNHQRFIFWHLFIIYKSNPSGHYRLFVHFWTAERHFSSSGPKFSISAILAPFLPFLAYFTPKRPIFAKNYPYLAQIKLNSAAFQFLRYFHYGSLMLYFSWA